MTREADVAAAYRRARLDDQRGYYHDRRVEYEKASNAAGWVATLFALLTALMGFLALQQGDDADAWIPVVATVVPALGTALAGYTALYGFDRLSKLYGDAERALAAVDESDAQAVARAEEVMRREQGQWGQFAEEPPVTPGGA